MKRSNKLVIGLLTAVTLLAGAISPAFAVDEIRLNTDTACPDGYPIKGQVSDVRSGVTYWTCKSQYAWDIEMMGGDTHAKWLASGGTYDASQDIANWKAERVAIEKLRTDTEALAKAVAQENPNTQVCKAYSYTSTYNGSGGGSFCTIHVATVDVSVPQVVSSPASDAVSASAFKLSVALVAPQATVTEVAPANKATSSYFKSTTKATKKLKKMSYTFAKGPKGSVVSVAKTAGDSCFVTGRTVFLGKGSECTVSVTVTKKGAVQGIKTYIFVR